MLIVHVTTTDPAGAAFNLARAVNQHTQHRARVVATQRISEYQFPHDLPAQNIGDIDEIKELLEKADVIHLHKVFEDFAIELRRVNPATKEEKLIKYVVGDFIKSHPKKVIYHIHGHPYERENPKQNGENYAARRARVLASTPDLEEMYKPFCNVQYFPNCVPINDALYLPRESDAMLPMHDNTNRYCVVQTPTNSVLKNCHVIKAAVKAVAERTKIPLFYLQLWQVLLEEALRHKRNGHIVFDHIEGYYGLSSLEGMSMGKPVIAGLSDYTRRAIAEFFNTTISHLPWLIAKNQDEIETKIESLLSVNNEWRRDVGNQSRKFMEQIWSDKNVGQRLAAIYETL